MTDIAPAQTNTPAPSLPPASADLVDGPKMFEPVQPRSGRTNEPPPKAMELNGDGTRSGQPKGADGKFISKEAAAPVKEPALEAEVEESPEPAQEPAKEAVAEEGPELADTIEGVAEQLGLTPEELTAHLKVKVGDKTVTLAEALSKRASVDEEQSAQLQEARTKFQGDVAQAQQTWQQKFSMLDAALQTAFHTMGPKPDLDAILASGGAEAYLKAKNEWDAKEGAFRQAVQARDQLAGQQTTEQKQRLDQARQTEREKLFKARPDWKDAKVRAEISSANHAFAKSLGFSDEEYSNLIDHRAFIVLDDARRWNELQSKQPAIEKKLLRLPPVLRPGTRQTQRVNPNQAKASQAMARLSKNPKDVQAGIALFQGLLK